MDLVEGSRLLTSLRHGIGASENKLFYPIIAFESDTDDLPIGAERELYNPADLARLDDKVREYIERSKPEVLAACAGIIAWLQTSFPGPDVGRAQELEP